MVRIMLYLIIKVEAINNIMRYLLNMRVINDEQKAKRKNNKYEKQATSEGYEVKFE